MSPFRYPSEPHVRRHGPLGYLDPASYRPWLRDEFTIRCVFCLRREQWDRATSLHIEHFLPTGQFAGHELQYDNLLYACARCNGAKTDQITADPCRSLLADNVHASDDGVLASTDVQAQQIIEQLRLNSPEMVHFRRLWLEIVAMAKQGNAGLYRQLLGFPDDLPDLSNLRPPGGNSRPEGIEQSFHARREQGKLAELY